MTDFADDVRYAYVRMGLEIGADADHVGYVVSDASVYRYATAERQILVRRMADFLNQRQQ